MERKRLREFGITIGLGAPGRKNSITDVPGVLVGHSTLIQGNGPLIPTEGPVRTGVTAILPHSRSLYEEPVVGAVHIINGFGKPTGIAQVQELGKIEAPILITNTLNVGLVFDAIVAYMIRENPTAGISTPTINPVVLECNDGYLNDIQGRHVHQEHVFHAIETANTEVVDGCVGAGTGMIAYGFKSGVGTASRQLPSKQGEYTVGCLVVPNCGRTRDLVINGTPIGALLEKKKRITQQAEVGSIIIVLATNAPLSSRQVGRLARRAVVGLSRTGSHISHGSGDFVVSFSTDRGSLCENSEHYHRERLLDRQLTVLFSAAVEATEEAILNALCMATTMKGRDDHLVTALPLDEIIEIAMKKIES
ncbi:MAG: P1 family peptidase [Candidatus Thorarchaeota archaeon]